MLTKIDLYREVLAIEPNSKVFFPLAKELSVSGRLDEAAAILRKGIAFHPDHLEAKFLLIEILTRLERKSEAEEAFSGVGEMLADYPSVWSLWAEKAAFATKDPTLALRFLAQFFKDGSLSWTAVLERGLGLDSGPASPVKQTAPDEIVDAAPSETEAGTLVNEAAFDAQSPVVAEADEGVVELRRNADADMGPIASDLEEAVAPLVDDGVEQGQTLDFAAEDDLYDAEDVDEIEDAGDESGPALRGADEVLSLSDILDDDQSLVSPDPAEPALMSGPYPAEATQVKPSAAGKKADAGADALPDMGVKTMTMASMLAQQGEAKAALSIYEDLLGAASSPEERVAIQEKIQELAPASDASPGRKSPPAKRKIKAAGFLKALAGRLEARAGL